MILTLFLIFIFGAQAAPKFDLPANAKIIETRTLTNSSHPDRALILWMIDPRKNPRDTTEIYTCPEYTRGHFYSGQTRVSLVDLKSGKAINTIAIKSEDQDSFDIPYKIAPYYYQVANKKIKESRPLILALKDFNGDGKAHEFVLYKTEGCMVLMTALIGYSETQDQVIQYRTVLKTVGGQSKSETVDWVDHLFNKQPITRGVWKYSIDYRGRGGTLDQYEIRYNPKLERFEGTLTFKE